MSSRTFLCRWIICWMHCIWGLQLVWVVWASLLASSLNWSSSTQKRNPAIAKIPCSAIDLRSGRYGDRTCDNLLVREVLYRWANRPMCRFCLSTAIWARMQNGDLWLRAITTTAPPSDWASPSAWRRDFFLAHPQASSRSPRSCSVDFGCHQTSTLDPMLCIAGAHWAASGGLIDDSFRTAPSGPTDLCWALQFAC